MPLAGVIDLDRERQRLESEASRLEDLLSRTRDRLENRQFLEKAPADVVEREREKERSLAEQRERLTAKIRALAGGP